MSLLVSRVTTPPVNRKKIPESLFAVAVLLAEFARSGLLTRIGSAIQIRRKAGCYLGQALVTCAITVLVAAKESGIRTFLTYYKQALSRLAAVSGCSSIPTSSSLSRALSSLRKEDVEDFTERTLTDLPGLGEMLAHPTVTHRDSHQQPWHVLDLDPTVQAFRQRDLPKGDDLPEAKRIAPGVPGYVGHHRGEIRIRHVPVLHAGSGLWLAYRVSEDNPHMAAFITPLLRSSIHTMNQAGVSTERIILRADGEFGSAGVIGAVLGLGLQIVTRVSRYELLDRPEIAEVLRNATWQAVRSTTGGRRREAADLGLVTLHPSKGSADEGAPPAVVRLIVTRSACPEKPSYGHWKEGFVFELFASSLDSAAWPAGDVVELYGERSVVENSFEQEDREYKLGRTFSYHAHGQAWMVSIGLLLWNYATCQGFLKASHPALPEPELRACVESVAIEAPASHEQVVAECPPEPVISLEESPPVNSDVPPPESSGEGHDLQDGPLLDVPPPESTSTVSDEIPLQLSEQERLVPVIEPSVPLDKIGELTRGAFMDVLALPGWQFQAAPVQLLCPEGKRLVPFCISKAGHHRPKPQLMIRTDAGACDGCSRRQGCFGSTRPNMYKSIARSIPPEHAKEANNLLKASRLGRPLSACSTKTKDRTSPSPTPLPIHAPLPPSTPGPWYSAMPANSPAAHRETFRRTLLADVVEIRIGRRETASPPARSGTDRRRPAHQKSHSRATFLERHARWVLDRRVEVRVVCSPRSSSIC